MDTICQPAITTLSRLVKENIMTTRYVLSFCTALVVGGAFVAVSAHAVGDADQNAPITMKNDQSIRLIRENAFFDRHIDKAVKHAAAAEVAGSQGKGPDLIRHTQLSLDQAREAQRAGNVPGLNEGIVALREAPDFGDTSILAIQSREFAFTFVEPWQKRSADLAGSFPARKRLSHARDPRRTTLTGRVHRHPRGPVPLLVRCRSSCANLNCASGSARIRWSSVIS